MLWHSSEYKITTMLIFLICKLVAENVQALFWSHKTEYEKKEIREAGIFMRGALAHSPLNKGWADSQEHILLGQ